MTQLHSLTKRIENFLWTSKSYLCSSKSMDWFLYERDLRHENNQYKFQLGLQIYLPCRTYR